MELIPLLSRLGYRYVLVDSENVEPVSPMGWQELRYRPHMARFDGEEITVVVRDRELSNAQESGMDSGWFIHEVAERTRHCDFPPLVTTCTDGDNGGWFRNTTPEANFWRASTRPAGPGRETERRHPPLLHRGLPGPHRAHGEVRVHPGAWNTGWHHGRDFTQWTGSQAQKDALAR